MGRGDNRRTPKTRRRKAQKRKKVAEKRTIQEGSKKN